MFCCGFRPKPASFEAERATTRERGGPPPTHSNLAFEEYRAETLRRLEQEQHDFHDFLDRLRIAKDKSEFDQFTAERRARTDPGTSRA